MMKYSIEILLFLIVMAGCASSKTNHSDYKDEDFQKKPLQHYNQKNDFYPQEKESSFLGLDDETLFFNPSQANEKDSLSFIQERCYKNDFSSAKEESVKVLSQFRKNPTYWNARGICEYLAGNELFAILYLNKALDISKNYAPALNNLGVIYLKQGDDQKALLAFKKASMSGRTSEIPKYNRARLYLKYGLLENAQAIFESLEKSHPQNKIFAAALISVYAKLDKSDQLKAMCSKHGGNDDASVSKNCK